MSEQAAISQIMKQIEEDKAKGLKGGSKTPNAKPKVEMKGKKADKSKKSGAKFAKTKYQKTSNVKKTEYLGEAEVDGELVDLYKNLQNDQSFYYEKLEHGSLIRRYV